MLASIAVKLISLLIGAAGAYLAVRLMWGRRS